MNQSLTEMAKARRIRTDEGYANEIAWQRHVMINSRNKEQRERCAKRISKLEEERAYLNGERR